MNLLKFMSVESMMLSKHLILCHPLILLPSIFPSIRVFSNESAPSGGQSIGASASASVLPMNIQGWFPLGLIGLISLHSKRLSRIFSSTTVQKHLYRSLGGTCSPAQGTQLGARDGLEGWAGRCWEEIQEGGDICIHIADLLHCTVVINAATL